MSELLSKLLARKSQVETAGQVWESAPVPSTADACHLQGLTLDAPAYQEGLKRLDITLEEDKLAEALADGLAYRRQNLPTHVIAGSAEYDTKKLQELAAHRADVQRNFKQEQASLATQPAELERREAEIRAREEAIELEKKAHKVRKETRKNYPQPKWLQNVEGTINIGVVGNSGMGKSLFINTVRRVRPQAHCWAPVGVNETTKSRLCTHSPGSRKCDCGTCLVLAPRQCPVRRRSACP